MVRHGYRRKGKPDATSSLSAPTTTSGQSMLIHVDAGIPPGEVIGRTFKSLLVEQDDLQTCVAWRGVAWRGVVCLRVMFWWALSI